jgi:hypothetical protein
MNEAISSYSKTVIVATAAAVAFAISGLVAIAFTPLDYDVLDITFGSLCLLLTIPLAGVISGGLVVIHRAKVNQAGKTDPFIALNRKNSEASLFAAGGSRVLRFKQFRRLLGAPQFIVGDEVRVRAFHEIEATLDANGCLEGLPFMDEMKRFCGERGRVFRCVDKIYDYGGRKDLRHMKDVVLLTGLRCDGGAHDGCQAGCYLLWKTNWLQAVEPSEHTIATRREGVRPLTKSSSNGSHATATVGAKRIYRCQFTDLVKASRPMKWYDPRLDLRPVVGGNVSFAALTVALLTRLFNLAQKLRGGTGFPYMPVSPLRNSARTELHLHPGERVKILSPAEIALTLNKNGKNRGLWFDREMLTYSGQEYKVMRKIERIIDDSNGQMIQMKTPCFVLDGVDCPGEHLRFIAQHDLPFWREAWLKRITQTTNRDPSVLVSSPHEIDPRKG